MCPTAGGAFSGPQFCPPDSQRDEGLTHRGGRPAIEVVAVPLRGDGRCIHNSGREVQDEGTAIKAQTLGRQTLECLGRWSGEVWVPLNLRTGQNCTLAVVRCSSGHLGTRAPRRQLPRVLGRGGFYTISFTAHPDTPPFSPTHPVSFNLLLTPIPSNSAMATYWLGRCHQQEGPQPVVPAGAPPCSTCPGRALSQSRPLVLGREGHLSQFLKPLQVLKMQNRPEEDYVPSYLVGNGPEARLASLPRLSRAPGGSWCRSSLCRR